jgi:hypothetical protein
LVAWSRSRCRRQGDLGAAHHPDGRQIALAGVSIDRVSQIDDRDDVWVLENFLPRTAR